VDQFPQPKQLLSVDEFVGLLDQKNPKYRKVKTLLRIYSGDIMDIYKKDGSFYELIKGRIGIYRLPIVDKKLQIIIEARGHHEAIAGALYCYHAAAKGEDPDGWDERIWGKLYVSEGHGYFFTGAYGNTKTVILDSISYKPDRHDKDLFVDLKIS
jgi:hypothetical protein